MVIIIKIEEIMCKMDLIEIQIISSKKTVITTEMILIIETTSTETEKDHLMKKELIKTLKI